MDLHAGPPQPVASTSKLPEGPPPPQKQKRNRARLSCMECRRLKLKCNRQFPCSNCIRRSCGNLCPDGVLKSDSKTSRLQSELSSLVARCDALSDIVRDLGGAHLLPPPLQLEFSGQPSQKGSTGHDSAVSERPSSGLQLPTETRNGDVERSNSLRKSQTRFATKEEDVMEDEDEEEATEEVLQGVGSLSIRDEDGRTRYLGVSAGSAYYTKDDDDSPSSDEDSTHPASRVTLHPFIQLGNSVSKTGELDRLRAFLPEADEVQRLSKNYWSYISFQFEPIEESTFYSDHLTNATTLGNHHGAKLACVFAVLSLGSLMDPRAPSTPNSNALHFFTLAWTSLSAARFLSQGTIAGVQAIQLLANYLLNTHDRQEGGETLWPILGAAVKMLVSMGMHRDGSQWDLEQKELDLRRRVWWEINTLDRMQALTWGRPPAFSPAHCDTEMPSDATPFHVWKWTLGSFIVRVTEQVFSVIPPSYSTIVTFDEELRTLFKKSPKELRSGALPDTAFAVRPTGPPNLPEVRLDGSNLLKTRMQRHTLDMIFCQIQLYLNLPAMRQALQLYPEEPLSSPWASSVVIVSLETGVYMLALAKSWVDLHPVLAPRWWHILFHAFSASVAQASIVIKSPRCALARHAWSQLNIAIDIFETASTGGAPVAAYVPRLKSLRDIAYASLQNAQSVPQGLGMAEFLAEGTDAHWILGPTTRLERKSKKKTDEGRASASPLNAPDCYSAQAPTVLSQPQDLHSNSVASAAEEAYTPFDSPVLPRNNLTAPQPSPAFDPLAALYSQHFSQQQYQNPPPLPSQQLSNGPFQFRSPALPVPHPQNGLERSSSLPQAVPYTHDPAPPMAFANLDTPFPQPAWTPGPPVGNSAVHPNRASPHVPMPTLDDNWLWHDFSAGPPPNPTA